MIGRISVTRRDSAGWRDLDWANQSPLCLAPASARNNFSIVNNGVPCNS